MRYALLILACTSACMAAVDSRVVFNTDFGNKDTRSIAVAVDLEGYVYVTGVTTAQDFGATLTLAAPGGLAATPSHVFVNKWSPDGSRLLYSVLIGGNSSDTPAALTVDREGNAYVTGETFSTNFPTTSNAYQRTLNGNRNAFLLKISREGGIGFATLLGGGLTSAAAVVLDRDNNPWIAGTAQSGLPVTAGARVPPTGQCAGPFLAINYPTSGDAFLAKFNSDASSLLFATTIGGSCGENGVGLGVDAAGKVWLTGATFSSNFPVTPDAVQREYQGGFGDGFLVRFTTAGALEYATYLGGSGFDTINAVTFDRFGDVWLTGASTDLAPASPDAFQPTRNTGRCALLGIGPPTFIPNGNAFIARLEAGRRVAGLTYLGAFCNSEANNIVLDNAGFMWISGRSSIGAAEHGYSMPTVNPLRIGAGTGFAARFRLDLTKLDFSTFLENPGDLALDGEGKAWITQPRETGSSLRRVTPFTPAIAINSVTSLFPEEGVDVTGVTPGKLVRLVGRDLGPASPVAGQIVSGTLGTTVAGVSVYFGEIAAPILSASATEIQCIVPFGVPTGSADVRVRYNDLDSNVVQVRILASSIDILGIFNADFTRNTEATPTTAGVGVTVYVTGSGADNPPGIDGRINTGPVAPAEITARVITTSGSINVNVTFAASAAGQVAGVTQVNFDTPAGISGPVTFGLKAGNKEVFGVLYLAER